MSKAQERQAFIDNVIKYRSQWEGCFADANYGFEHVIERLIGLCEEMCLDDDATLLRDELHAEDGDATYPMIDAIATIDSYFKPYGLRFYDTENGDLCFGSNEDYRSWYPDAEDIDDSSEEEGGE